MKEFGSVSEIEKPKAEKKKFDPWADEEKAAAPVAVEKPKEFRLKSKYTGRLDLAPEHQKYEEAVEKTNDLLNSVDIVVGEAYKELDALEGDKTWHQSLVKAVVGNKISVQVDRLLEASQTMKSLDEAEQENIKKVLQAKALALKYLLERVAGGFRAMVTRKDVSPTDRKELVDIVSKQMDDLEKATRNIEGTR